MTNDTDNPTVHTNEIPNERIRLHERAELPDGTPVGRRGGKWFVLDSEERAVSKGYHEIHPVDGRPGTYEGKIGARREMFTVSQHTDA